MRPIDTSIEARRRQLDAFRAMTPQQRLRLADEMSGEVRSLARSGIRARMPAGSTEADIDAELARILLGPDLASALEALRNAVPR